MIVLATTEKFFTSMAPASHQISRMKRARPQGLGASAAAKKEKPEEEQVDVIEAEGEVASNSTEKLFYELPEDATALDQLRALFESATMFLGKYSLYLCLYIYLLDDTTKAKPIFNGVIHECLRLEAILDKEEGPEEQEGDDKDLDSFLQVKKDSDKIFGSEFYFIFGESLRTLAELEMNDEIEESSMEQVKGLLSASIDRFQLSKEKLSIETESSSPAIYSADLMSGLVYAMASLCVLIEETEELKEALKGLIKGESKESASSAMFDAVEFNCNFIETAFENEFEISGIDHISETLEKNLKLLEEFSIDAKKMKIVKVDVPLRLAIVKCEEIDAEKASCFLADLEEILKEEEDPSIRFEALQLKASIKEILGLEEEATKIYEEADLIQTAA